MVAVFPSAMDAKDYDPGPKLNSGRVYFYSHLCHRVEFGTCVIVLYVHRRRESGHHNPHKEVEIYEKIPRVDDDLGVASPVLSAVQQRVLV